jgi:competence protein ComEC
MLGLVLGTAVQLQQRELFALSMYVYAGLFALFLLALLTSKKPAIHWRMGLVLVALVVLSFSATGLRATAFLNQSLAPALEGQDVAVVGVVSAMPQRNESGLRFRFEVESAQVRGQAVSVPPNLHLGWYSGVFGGANTDMPAELQRQPVPMAAGERWQLTVRLKAPHGGSNPFGFDYELWLWEQGLQATGYVRVGPKDPAPLRLVQTGQHPVEWARQKVRDRIFAQVADRQQAGLIAALVVGDQNAIDRTDWDVFRDTGVAHLMSISGLHVTMFAWLAALVVGWLWRRSGTLCLWVPAPNAALVCGVLLAAAYAAFSGGGLPSQRTVLMLATVGVLRLSGKQWPWPLVWLLACAAVVVVDPWALLQAGFWLSFVAVGVLFATDSGAAQAHKKGFIGHISSVFSEQWVITLALTPLTLLLFGQVSIVGLAANALAIPWVTLVVTPLAMAGVLLPLLWELAALAVSALAWYLKILASLPFASVTVAQAPLWAGVAGVVGGLLLAMPWPWRFRFLGFPLVLPVLLWQAPRPVEGQFELMAADIGQGNSVVVRTANHALVYDAGPRFSRDSDAGHRVLVPLLRALDVSVDRLMISHRDSDHVGGALAVLSQQPQADLMSSVEDDNAIQAVRKVTRCVAGQHWRWDGIDFDVLHPSAQDYALPNKSNAMSCVLRISNGSHTALLAGDIEQAQELRLVAGEGARLRADVLLVPHHGSKTSSSAEFLDAVKPSFALVQSGYRNRYGHPAEPVLVRYAERKIAVVDSPHCGAATWQSAHPTLVKCQREEGMRYWNHRAP